MTIFTAQYVAAVTAETKAYTDARDTGRTSPSLRTLRKFDHGRELDTYRAPAGYVLYLLHSATRELTTGEACDFCGAGYGTAQARDADDELLTLCPECWASYGGLLTPEQWHAGRDVCDEIVDEMLREQGYRDEDIDGPRAHLDR